LTLVPTASLSQRGHDAVPAGMGGDNVTYSLELSFFVRIIIDCSTLDIDNH